jgi:hypothetical protein
VTSETAAATIVEYLPLAKTTAAGATVLVEPFKTDDREAAMVQSSGRYTAEIHTVSLHNRGGAFAREGHRLASISAARRSQPPVSAFRPAS